MSFTIKISDTSPQAVGIINMLKALAKDYDFLHITEDTNLLSTEQSKELKRRHSYVKKNPTIGKTWEELERSL